MNIYKISQASVHDYVAINAKVARLYGNFACIDRKKVLQDKINELIATNRPQHQIDMLKEKIKTLPNNCELISKKPIHAVSNIHYHKCLCNFNYPLFDTLWTYFENYEKGNLPFKGSVSEQPNQIMELFQILNNAKSYNEQLLKEKANKKVQ